MRTVKENLVKFLEEEQRRELGRAFELHDIICDGCIIDDAKRTAYRECERVFNRIDGNTYNVFGLNEQLDYIVV